MTAQELEAKTKLLEKWLAENPNSPERNLIESDLKELRTKIEYQEYERSGSI